MILASATVWLAGLRAACPVPDGLPSQTATGTIRPDRRKSFRGEEGFQGETGTLFQADCKLKRNTGLA